MTYIPMFVTVRYNVGSMQFNVYKIKCTNIISRANAIAFFFKSRNLYQKITLQIRKKIHNESMFLALYMRIYTFTFNPVKDPYNATH